MVTSIYIVLFLLLIPIVVSDLRTHRVPNLLALGGVLAVGLLQVFIAVYSGDYSGLIPSGAGLLIAVAIGYMFWHGSLIGGGDHKTLMLVGVSVGYPTIIPTLLCIAIAGGIQSLAWIAFGLCKANRGAVQNPSIEHVNTSNLGDRVVHN